MKIWKLCTANDNKERNEINGLFAVIDSDGVLKSSSDFFHLFCDMMPDVKIGGLPISINARGAEDGIVDIYIKYRLSYSFVAIDRLHSLDRVMGLKRFGSSIGLRSPLSTEIWEAPGGALLS